MSKIFVKKEGKKCQTCGKNITWRNSNAKYCSNSCRQKAFYSKCKDEYEKDILMEYATLFENDLKSDIKRLFLYLKIAHLARLEGDTELEANTCGDFGYLIGEVEEKIQEILNFVVNYFASEETESLCNILNIKLPSDQNQDEIN